MALPGGGMFAMTWRGIAAVWRRRVPGSPGGDKRGQGTDGSLSPLDTPDPPLRRDFLRSRGEMGVAGARFRASDRLWDALLP